ncbi:hypothetical protein HU200_032811 [Digitaria exilis]|uniref:Splicing factor Cactin n=1 Tax=Digitaria exilis TaxID=1010633 RepID=A0A835ERT1_9POAL|nr:hypothetical protein HU200_032811 [Digitaria exilis]
MGKPHGAASPAIARNATRPSRTLSRAVRRRAVAVSEKLAARGLGAFVWRKKLDHDLARGVLPGIVSARSERRRCLDRRKEADRVRTYAAAARRASPPPVAPPAASSLSRAEEEEAAFLLEQSRRRAGIRFAEGRPRRIDMLVESLAGARRCALAAFRGASVEELKELGEEIGTLADLDTANGAFWVAAKVLCDAEIFKATAGGGTDGRGAGYLHSEVAADVMSVVEGKSLEELDVMQRTIAGRMTGGESMIGNQLQEVMGLIRVEKAKKFLAQNYSSSGFDDAPPSFDDDHKTEARRELEDGIADADEEGSEPLRPVALPPATRTPAAEGTEWRKPKYVARARTGYEWNKYNRAHYDHDHPPPKIVRGYTFVVHYPELAGGARPPPQCTVEEEDGGETCVVRFHAGWPYEDVAFRIVNREWERSQKAGFRCTFDERGVLRLSFHFKRFFYKR